MKNLLTLLVVALMATSLSFAQSSAGPVDAKVSVEVIKALTIETQVLEAAFQVAAGSTRVKDFEIGWQLYGEAGMALSWVFTSPSLTLNGVTLNGVTYRACVAGDNIMEADAGGSKWIWVKGTGATATASATDAVFTFSLSCEYVF